MSLLDQNSKNVYFLFSVTLREICSMGATAPEAVADRSAVLRQGSWVPIPVESWVGTDIKPSLFLLLHILSSPVSLSPRKQEDSLWKEICISPSLFGYNSTFILSFEIQIYSTESMETQSQKIPPYNEGWWSASCACPSLLGFSLHWRFMCEQRQQDRSPQVDNSFVPVRDAM